MEHTSLDQNVAQRSALIYVPISLGIALAFLLASSVFGSYPLVAKLGGTLWVGLLSLIVTMPIVTARVKHYRREAQ